MPTFYDTLGLSRDATEDDIKKAYRDLQLKHHPDKTRNLPQHIREESETISKAVNVAYETLSDERLRRAYDKNLQNPSLLRQPSPVRRSYRSSKTPQSSPFPRPRTPPQPRPRSRLPTCPTSSPQKNGRPVPLISRVLSGTANGWRWSITIAGRFLPTELTTASIKVRTDMISITLKLREQMPNVKPDVHIAIKQAEGSRRISKLQSSYKAQKSFGVGAAGYVYLLELSFLIIPPSRTLPSYPLARPETLSYAWNLTTDMHAFAPPACLAFASCMTFHRSLEDANLEHVRDSFIAHPYGHSPQTVLSYDDDMGLCGSKGRFVLEDMQGEEEGWVAWKGCKMLRRAAFGWVEKIDESARG